MRVKVTLACTECKQRNYNTMKNKKNNADRIEMNKYCKFCKKHTLHKETSDCGCCPAWKQEKEAGKHERVLQGR